MMFFLQSGIFLLSTILVLSLSYLRVSNNVFQQITAFLFALTLIFFTRIMFPRSKLLAGIKLKILLLFLTSALVQFLIISSGGFYSPFLIILHLYTLGTSFLLNSRSPISFLIFSVIALVVNIYVNPEIMAMFRNDPGPIILYGISFIVIIPLAQFLMYSYHLKDSLFNSLKAHFQIGQQREGSILTGLSEMVIVTDKDFNIISANKEAEKIFYLSEEGMLHKNIFSILALEDESGEILDSKNSSFEDMSEGVARIVNNLYFQSRNKGKRKVSLQIRPIPDPKGAITQIVFIISDSIPQAERHADLIQATEKYKLLADDLRQTLSRANLTGPIIKLNILEKIEEDLNLASEIEDHSIAHILEPFDVAYVAKKAMDEKQELARSLGLGLEYEKAELPPSEKAMFDLLDSNPTEKQVPITEFSIITNKKWVGVILQKLLDMAILLASERAMQIVKIRPNLKENDLSIEIIFPYQELLPNEKEEIFQKYYGNLGIKTNLHSASGLEGFIAKTAANELNLVLGVDYEKTSSSLIFFLNFPKIPTESV